MMMTAYSICAYYPWDFAISFYIVPWVFSVKIYKIVLTGLAGLTHLQWKKSLMGLKEKLKINPEEGIILT